MKTFIKFFSAILFSLFVFSQQAKTQIPETVTCGKGKKYVASEIKQLVDFLNLPGVRKGETNAQALGIKVAVTMNNVDEWGFGNSAGGGIYVGKDFNFKETDGIRYIYDLKIASSTVYAEAIRLGGHLQIQNFKHLQWITFDNPYLGDLITVKDCPDLEEFYLNRPQWNEDAKDPQKERRLEIENCPALKKIEIIGFLTAFETDNNFELENVTLSQTNIKCIDFSKQKQLKNLVLRENKFSQIILPNRSDYREIYQADFQYNPIEPANLVPMIRAYYGDSLFYDKDYNTGDWKFNSGKSLYLGEFGYHNVTVCDPVTGLDSLTAGSKINLSALATFNYGVPAVPCTGRFEWSATGKNVEGKYVSLNSWNATEEMKKGIYIIPKDMMGATITCRYSASPLLTDDRGVTYTINVSAKLGKAVNFAAKAPATVIPVSCEEDK